jgi:hypothetical protein
MTLGIKILLITIAGTLMIASPAMGSSEVPPIWRERAEIITLVAIFAGSIVGVWLWVEK